ncbi:hypothetical protein PVL29_007817 [Vitis rotundifolia]|uniref:Uncharacterized protein n=1 Tax=Vitis rotundifolia TaxID=103349 RepID=A0AA39DYV0_VITRO|nr:hypothetical protein PVL29_007817 [Vitis rotundifolia]
MGFGEDEESVLGLPNKSIFRCNSPLVQVCLIGLVCFYCPRMFNALSRMGEGGQVDVTIANNANTALYTTFVIFGILGGGIYNILGPCFTLFAGCSTYMLLMVPTTWAGTRPRPAPKTHLVRGWDHRLFCKWEWETLTRPVPGLGRGWERDLYNWDGNGVGVAPPKPAPLPILSLMVKNMI